MPFKKSALLICGVFLCSFVFAQNQHFKDYDAQNSFRKIKFNSELSAVKRIVKFSDSAGGFYQVGDKNYLSWGNWIFELCVFIFTNNKLAAVQLSADNYDYDDLYAGLKYMFGEPTKKASSTYWIGKNIVVSMYKDSKGQTVLIETKSNYENETPTGLDNL